MNSHFIQNLGSENGCSATDSPKMAVLISFDGRNGIQGTLFLDQTRGDPL